MAPADLIRSARIDQPWRVCTLEGEWVELGPGRYEVREAGTAVALRAENAARQAVIDHLQLDGLLRTRALVFLSW